MQCIVPLAGPDFFDPRYGIKPLIDLDGAPLIERTLRSRAWLNSGALREEDILFVLRETAQTETARAALKRIFPAAGAVTIDRLTGGALMSAAAAVPLLARFDRPLMVDLADLIFDGPDNLDLDGAAGLIPWFPSDDAAYSYLRCDGDRVLETAEKRVISDRASAGAYLFGSAALYMDAVSGCMKAPDDHRVRGALFVCPAYNVLIGQGHDIRARQVANVACHSKAHHPTRTPA